MNRWRARSASSRGAPYPLSAPQIGLPGARGEFVLHLQRDVQRERCHQLDQQRANRPVDDAAGYGLAILRTARRLDPFAIAHVIGIWSPFRGLVAHRHVPAAHAAEDQALQQRGPFARGAASLRRGVCLGIVPELALILLEPLPGDVARVGIAQQDRPFLACQEFRLGAASGTPPAAVAPVHESARVSRVVQNPPHAREPQGLPVQFTPVRPALRMVRKQQLLVVEMPDRGAGRAGPREDVEHEAQAVLHLLVGVEHHLAERVVDQPQRERQLQLPALGLGQQSAAQPDAHHMQLRFRHGPFKSQE